jgi:hypothetical protein
VVVVFGSAPVVVTLAEGGAQVIVDRMGRGADSEAVVIGGGRARYHRSASGDDGCNHGMTAPRDLPQSDDRFAGQVESSIVKPFTRYSARRAVAHWRNYVHRWLRTRNPTARMAERL